MRDARQRRRGEFAARNCCFAHVRGQRKACGWARLLSRTGCAPAEV